MLLNPRSTALALSTFLVSTMAQGLNAGLKVKHISVALTSESITQNIASLNFDVSNSLTAPTTIQSMSAKLGTLGLTILSFDHSFTNFVVPAEGTVNSGTIPNATLTLGVLSTVQLLLLPALDIIEADMTLSMRQAGVPTNITLNLL